MIIETALILAVTGVVLLANKEDSNQRKNWVNAHANVELRERVVATSIDHAKSNADN